MRPVALDLQRIGPLDVLDRRVGGVGHVGVHPVGAIEVAERALAPSTGLHVGERGAQARVNTTYEQRVHAPGRRRHFLPRTKLVECSEQDIADPLTRDGRAHSDGGGAFGIDQRAASRHDADRVQQAGIRGQLRIEHRLQHVEYTARGQQPAGVDGPPAWWSVSEKSMEIAPSRGVTSTRMARSTSCSPSRHSRTSVNAADLRGRSAMREASRRAVARRRVETEASKRSRPMRRTSSVSRRAPVELAAPARAGHRRRRPGCGC